MNPVVLWFASGDSLYAGAVVLFLVIVVSPHLERRWLLPLRHVGAWLALAMIVMASPPFPWIADAIFLVGFVLSFALLDLFAAAILGRLRTAATGVLLVMLLVFPAVELSHRAMPVIAGEPGDHLVVIGDSISSGIDPGVPAWPAVMQQMTGVPVKNLAQPGAQVISGQTMAEKAVPEDRVVLIELGGNDLLAGVPSDEFGRGLESILTKLSAPGRTVVMFELPLLPHKIAYGRIQRRLAEKYGVWLIPKRYFTGVIGGRNSTLDGLHLSEGGAHHMAALVAEALSRVLKPPVSALSVS